MEGPVVELVNNESEGRVQGLHEDQVLYFYIIEVFGITSHHLANPGRRVCAIVHADVLHGPKPKSVKQLLLQQEK